MIEPFLRSQLEPIARRRRRFGLARDLAIVWGGAAVIALFFFWVYRLTGWITSWLLPVLIVASVLATVVVWVRSRRWLPDFRQIARQIEQRHPELHALLLTAVEQQPDPETGKYNYLQERVIQQAAQRSLAGQWIDTVSDQRLLTARLLQLGALVLLIVALTGLRVQTKEAIAFAQPTRLKVTPGNTLVERGNVLAVLARFEGPLPPDVMLVLRPDGQPEQRLSMAKSLNDPVFGATLQEVTNSLSYYVTYAGGRSPDYKVEVFEYPRLERADADLTFPAYTGLAEKKIPDTRRITAVEGSKLNLGLQLNKPVASAQLVARDKTVLPLLSQTNRANAALENFALEHSQTYELILVDTAGRTNKVPAQIIVDVLTNRTPELHFNFPKGDQKVSPLQEVTFQGEAWDDFGLKGYGITYTLAGGKPHTVALGSDAAAREKRQFTHVVKLEDLAAEPDQLLSYFIWADDVGPDGKVRRTASDMYYAEVRPFEQIFREGQPRPQNESEEEGEGEAESAKLAELQKQILNATWRLQRENNVGLDAADPNSSEKPKARARTPNYSKDVGVVEKSQKDALKQATGLKGQAQNARAKALWASVETAMSQAADQLRKAGKSPEPLPAAVDAEQAAYQALLKLASREFQISQSRSRSRSQSSQAMQRELDQLDLKQSENKYETQKQAAAKQNPQQREQQQVLNRLKELAQRQQDLNERLKELQTALQEAKTDQEREDIQRRLKRLREEEQQMLADVDELAQRMEKPENQSRMADARQQLEQTRNQVQRTAEQLGKEAVGQALSSGTRAQRQLQDLRDEFRKKNSAQFADDMKQMRSDARDLAQKEEQIGDKLQSMADDKHKTLSDSGERKQLADQMGQQSQKMTNLLEQMSRVSQEAETSEPLLSKDLYDTLRKASQGNANESLQKAKQLLDLSFVPQAGQLEQRARKEIEDLKQGVEHAAEGVLGDETEALRLARNELDDLARQLDQEMQQAQRNGTNRIASAGQPGQQGASQQQGRPRPGQQGEPGQNPDQQPGGQNPGQLAQANQANPGDNQGGNTPGQRQNRQNSRNQQSNRGQSPNGSQRGNQQSQQANASDSQQNAQQPGNGQQGDAQQAQANQQGQGNQGGQQANQGGRQGGQPRQRQSLTAQRGQGQNPGQGGQQPGQGQNPGQGNPQPGDQQQAAAGQGGGGGFRPPITGDGFNDWSDRLRDVEELLDSPDLRNEVAGARERARALRLDFKHLKKPPQWDVVRSQIAEPLVEVRNRINEELARRESKDALVPIDRDPVPQKFSELVRRYYEKLGSGDAGTPATPK